MEDKLTATRLHCGTVRGHALTRNSRSAAAVAAIISSVITSRCFFCSEWCDPSVGQTIIVIHALEYCNSPVLFVFCSIFSTENKWRFHFAGCINGSGPVILLSSYKCNIGVSWKLVWSLCDFLFYIYRRSSVLEYKKEFGFNYCSIVCMWLNIISLYDKFLNAFK